MKTIAHVLIVLLALFGAYALYATYAPDEWPRLAAEPIELQALSAGAEGHNAASTSTNAPALTRAEKETRRIDCPTCNGEGRLSYADGRGANHTYACPICNGQGGRTLRVREGQHVCPDCMGMGVTERREARQSFGGPKDHNRQVANTHGNISDRDAYYVRPSRCLRCNTTGVIAAAKPPRPTLGVQPPEPAR
jgi:hypothetical protein